MFAKVKYGLGLLEPSDSDSEGRKEKFCHPFCRAFKMTIL